MAHHDDARQLLLGILALQNAMVEPADLIAAFQRWSRDSARSLSLAEVMVERGVLTEGTCKLLDELVRIHVAKHGGDPERSLAAVRNAGPAGMASIGPGAPSVEATLSIILSDRGLTAAVTDAEMHPPAPAATSAGADTDADATTDWESRCPEPASGRFHVLRPHARGGIGQVSVALDTELHREVAYKEIRREQADDPASRARFVLEAEVTGRLEHPGVVPVYGLGTLPGGRPYYAMRFVRGETLKEAIARFHQPGGPWRFGSSSRGSSTSARPWLMRIAGGSSAATSSRRTSCWAPTARRCSWTGDSPR